MCVHGYRCVCRPDVYMYVWGYMCMDLHTCITMCECVENNDDDNVIDDVEEEK